MAKEAPERPAAAGTPARIDSLLKDARNELARAHPENSPAETRLEAELLLGAATGLRRSELIAWPERDVSAVAEQGFMRMIARRRAGEPIAYILGEREFRGLSLRINPATLIPRPETELLVDWALAQFPPETRVRCADLGTGSGAIAIAIARERPNWFILGLDASATALTVAAANRQRLGAKNLALLQGDWLAALGEQRLDLIVANPPYVAEQDPHLTRGDLRFEPPAALAAGRDGLAAIRRITAALPSRLAPGGRAAIEHGWDQGAAVRALLRTTPLRHIETHRDLAGHERFTTAAAQ
jgi:release factor glutamine methyltransferase